VKQAFQEMERSFQQQTATKATENYPKNKKEEV
jgi:hypothetical protein